MLGVCPKLQNTPIYSSKAHPLTRCISFIQYVLKQKSKSDHLWFEASYVVQRFLPCWENHFPAPAPADQHTDMRVVLISFITQDVEQLVQSSICSPDHTGFHWTLWLSLDRFSCYMFLLSPQQCYEVICTIDLYHFSRIYHVWVFFYVNAH